MNSKDLRAETDKGIPKLRFPEFLGQPLHGVQLGDVTEEASTRNGGKLAAASVMGVRKEGGIVPMEERLVAGDISRYKIVRSNWFAYNPMRLNIGSIARWQGGGEVLVSPDYVVFRCSARAEPTALIPEYLDHFRSSRQWQAFTNESGDGGVRIRIYYRDLARMQLLLPSAIEQHKIADCLSSIDALIAAEADKLEALKDHKKGLMQQLFPAPGETTPRLRFPEFQGGANWEERPLGAIASYQNGKAYEPHIVEEGQFIVVNARFISTDGAIKKWTNNPLLIAESDDILMVLSDLPNGRALAKCYRVREDNKYAVNQRVARLTPHAIRSDFLFSILNRHPYLLGFNDNLNQTHLSKDNVLTCPILLPTHEEEQIAIADCLSSVDGLIAAQVDRLSALKAHKNGLMQQLFPVASEA